MTRAADVAKPEDVIPLLATEDGVATACEAVSAWATAGRWRDLGALAAELEERADPANAETQLRFETVADHVEDQLALCSGDAAIDDLLALSVRPRERSVTRARSASARAAAFASRLGYGQPPAAFLAALERSSQRADQHELFACWMHEVILRGTVLSGDARAERFQGELAVAGHPLAALPLELHRIEREAPSYMPLYGDKGLGRAIDALTSGPMSARTVPPPADGAAVRATRVDDADFATRVSAALRPWLEGAAGKAETKLFALSPAVRGGGLGSWLLRALPLDSTTATARLDVSRTGAEGVFGPLFSAASNGGASSSGLGGARGRLAAWTSLGALVGAPAGTAIPAIATMAEACSFLTFRAPGPWFHDVAWDLGALALRADGLSVAVVAASDAE